MSVQTGRDGALAESEVFHILGNDRRRAIVDLLADESESVAVSDIATAIAERESDASTVPNNLYKSVYVSLQQTHLPQLEEDDVIDYDPNAKTIRQGPQYQDVLGYIESDQGVDERILQLTLGIAVLGLLVVVLAGMDIPGLEAVNPVLWSVLALIAIAITNLYCLLA